MQDQVQQSSEKTREARFRWLVPCGEKDVVMSKWKINKWTPKDRKTEVE